MYGIFQPQLIAYYYQEWEGSGKASRWPAHVTRDVTRSKSPMLDGCESAREREWVSECERARPSSPLAFAPAWANSLARISHTAPSHTFVNHRIYTGKIRRKTCDFKQSHKLLLKKHKNIWVHKLDSSQNCTIKFLQAWDFF